jgi:hypothetical protein
MAGRDDHVATPPPRIGELPSDEALKPVTAAASTVLGVLAPRMPADDNG